MEKLNCQIHQISASLCELLKDGSIVPFYVSGSSMNPFLISRRDIVWLKSFDVSDLKNGEIILFRRSDGSFVMHRIVRMCPDNKIQVQGDAQTWSEEINPAQIIAVVSDIQRKGKRRSADSFYWKSISFFWRILTPLRSVIMRVWFKFKRMKVK